jgi:hypothetical protein
VRVAAGDPCDSLAVRVVHRSEKRLVLRETPAVAWLLSAVLLGGSLICFILIIVTAWALVAAIPMGFFGLWIYVLGGVRAIVDFDGQRGTLTIKRRRIGKLPDEEHALGAITDVEIEVSDDGEGGQSYILVFKLADGSRVPPVFTSPHDLDHHMRTARVVRTFLGLAGDVPRRPLRSGAAEVTSEVAAPSGGGLRGRPDAL